MKKNPFLGIALLSGTALVISKTMKPTTEEATTNSVFGFTDPGETLESAIVKAFKNNKELQRLTKGEAGSPGATGGTGPIGLAGAAGDSYRAFAGSLVKNGAAELNTADGWADAVLGVVHEGLFSLDFAVAASKNCLNSNTFHIDNRRLLKVTAWGKVSAGNFGFYIKRMDKDGVAIIQAGNVNIFPLNTINHSNTAWEQKVAYFGGTSTATTQSIGSNTAKGQISLYLSAAGTLSISHLCVQHVPLGESVPYNLAYLPEGQHVYDPTTGKLGRYNGTAVVWNG